MFKNIPVFDLVAKFMKRSKRFELNQNRRVWGRKGYSCCNTPAKKFAKPAACGFQSYDSAAVA